MKPVKFNQKLKLNKQTIANLDQNEMSSMYGGYKPLPPESFVVCGTNEGATLCAVSCQGQVCATSPWLCDPTAICTPWLC